MNLGLRLELSPELPSLPGYEHLDAIRRRYHQRSIDGTVNHVFAGGMGVKILLDADRVQRSPLRNPHVKDERTHKDIEVYAFWPVFGDKNPNPHDICVMDASGCLHKLDYHHHPGNASIYVELLRGAYFDFAVLPTPSDVRVAAVQGKRYLTLSPEFFVASKLLKTKPFREGIDDVDALQLLRRFSVNLPYFTSIARRTRFGDIVSDDDLANLEARVSSGAFFRTVRDAIVQRYAGVVPFVDLLHYNDAITLLEFDPASLRLDHIDPASLFNIRHELRTKITPDVHEDPVFQLSLLYLLSQLPYDCRTPRQDEYVLSFARLLGNNIEQHNGDQALAQTIAAHQVLELFNHVEDPQLDPFTRAGLAYHLIRLFIAGTFYLHVEAARHKSLFADILSGKRTTLSPFYQSLVADAGTMRDRLFFW